MDESTNANHPDPGKRTDIMLDDRIEYGYSPAEQRPSGTMIDILRDWRRPYPMATNMGCITHHVVRRSFVRPKCNDCGHPLNSSSKPCNFPRTTRVQPFDPPQVSAHDHLWP